MESPVQPAQPVPLVSLAQQDPQVQLVLLARMGLTVRVESRVRPAQPVPPVSQVQPGPQVQQERMDSTARMALQVQRVQPVRLA